MSPELSSSAWRKRTVSKPSRYVVVCELGHRHDAFHLLVAGVRPPEGGLRFRDEALHLRPVRPQQPRVVEARGSCQSGVALGAPPDLRGVPLQALGVVEQVPLDRAELGRGDLRPGVVARRARVVITTRCQPKNEREREGLKGRANETEWR
jgi:hypothetical protein